MIINKNDKAQLQQNAVQLILNELGIKVSEPSTTHLFQDSNISTLTALFLTKLSTIIMPLLPTATFILPNARADATFEAEIEISLSNDRPALVEDVRFPEEIGLQFHKETQSFSGKPTVSGDIKLEIDWSSEGITQTSELVLIINPDPRTLWKIIEPPADDPYFKENVAHAFISDAEVQIAAASRRGRSHEHVGSFRDDDFYISHNAATGWSVLLVADGAGSAKNSRQGSKIVTETVGSYLSEQLSNKKELSALIASWKEEEQKEIFNYFIETFHQAAKLGITQINAEAINAENDIKSYATTLLASVSFTSEDQFFAASFWLGDGAIAAYGPTGKVRLLGTPDSGEYAGQTRFLDMDAINATDFHKRVVIGKWPDISHLVLMTDGVSDPYFETDNGLQDPARWDALIKEITPILETANETPVSGQLAEWLNFFSPGDHDDRTIVISYGKHN